MISIRVLVLLPLFALLTFEIIFFADLRLLVAADVEQEGSVQRHVSPVLNSLLDFIQLRLEGLLDQTVSAVLLLQLLLHFRHHLLLVHLDLVHYPHLGLLLLAQLLQIAVALPVHSFCINHSLFLFGSFPELAREIHI